MSLFASILIILVAVQHFAFCALEMFFWTKPLGLKMFGLDPEFAKKSRSLAANQGLYNAFLATGLLLPFLSPGCPLLIARYFLGCVVVAGIFGALTVKPRIFYVQSLPALLAFALTWL